MELNALKFARAAALTAGAAYVVCVLFVAAAPDLALRFLGWLVHLTNVEQFVGFSVTFGGAVLGLLPILFYSYFGAWLFAFLYNRSLK